MFTNESDLILYLEIKLKKMKKIFRALLAGWGAKKLGGGKCGCIGTIIVFIIIYILLGPVFKLI